MDIMDPNKRSLVGIRALFWAQILVKYTMIVMQNYLTDVWEVSITYAAGVLNIWGGIAMMLRFVLLFLTDAFLGHFKMLVISSIFHTLGIGLVAMSTPPILAESIGMCKEFEPQCIGETQKAVFHTGMALLSVGMAGLAVSVRPFYEEHADESKSGAGEPCILLHYFLIVLLPIVFVIVYPYVKSWVIIFGIPAIFSAFTTIVFLSGWRTYTKVDPLGSSLTNVCRVLMAASTCNILKSFPNDADLIYLQKDNLEPQSFSRSRCLGWLEKAAVISPGEDSTQVKNNWKLCSVSDVEEAKIVLRMVPMWLTFIVCGIVSSIGNTYFTEQANHMNRKIGTWEVPIQLLYILVDVLKIVVTSLVRLNVWISRTGRIYHVKCKSYLYAIGIGVAMIFSILGCITAARIEKKRLNVIRNHDLLNKPDVDIPMSVYWLIFQLLLLAGLDAFFADNTRAFYKAQAPESMIDYLDHLTAGVYGVGYMFGVLSVFVVGKISQVGGHKNWFQHTLNESRFDRYYWVLAALSSVNLLVFIMVASTYSYHREYKGPVPIIETEISAIPPIP